MSKKNKKPQPAVLKSAPQAVSAPAIPAFFSNSALHCWLIMAFSFLLYANTLNYGFVQDDGIVITDNMFTTQGIKGIPGILKYDTFYGFFKEAGKTQLVAGGRYRPLSLVMFAIEWELFGNNPFFGHLINILLYGLTGIVLYLLLLKLLQPRFGSTTSLLISLIATLLFMGHPVHTEVVANIKGRDEILTLLGSLAAVYYSLKAFDENKPLYNVLAGVLFFLALLSKENAITFVAIVPIAYWYFTKAKTGKIIAQTIPFAAAAALFLVIRTAVIGAQFVSQPMELLNNPFLKLSGNQFVPFSLGEKLATITFTLGKYIGLLVFPHPLTHDYYPRAVGIMQWGDWQVILSLLLYLALIGYVIKTLSKKSIIGFGIIFYLATLFIVSNILFPVGTNMGERFVFMPSLGFCLSISALLYFAVSGGKTLTNFKRFYPVIGIIGVVLLLFTGKTILRNTAWESNFILFTNDVKYSPESAKLQNSVGGELSQAAAKEKDPAKRTAMLNEAIGHLQIAIRIHPGYKNAFLLLGNCYLYLDDYENAIAQYQNALKLDPGYKDALGNLAMTYAAAGRYYGEKKGDVGKAIQYLSEAYKMNNKDAETLRLLGVAYGVLGSTQGNPAYTKEAVNYFTKAVELQPTNANTLYDLGTAYFNIGDAVHGNEFRQRAIRVNPNIEKERGIKK